MVCRFSSLACEIRFPPSIILGWTPSDIAIYRGDPRCAVANDAGWSILRNVGASRERTEGFARGHDVVCQNSVHPGPCDGSPQEY